MSIAPYAKAVAAFVSTAAAGIVAALLLGSDGGGTVTVGEWIAIAASTVVATTAVFSVPNRPAEGEADVPPPPPAAPSRSYPDPFV